MRLSLLLRDPISTLCLGLRLALRSALSLSALLCSPSRCLSDSISTTVRCKAPFRELLYGTFIQAARPWTLCLSLSRPQTRQTASWIGSQRPTRPQPQSEFPDQPVYISSQWPSRPCYTHAMRISSEPSDCVTHHAWTAECRYQPDSMGYSRLRPAYTEDYCSQCSCCNWTCLLSLGLARSCLHLTLGCDLRSLVQLRLP